MGNAAAQGCSLALHSGDSLAPATTLYAGNGSQGCSLAVSSANGGSFSVVGPRNDTLFTMPS